MGTDKNLDVEVLIVAGGAGEGEGEAEAVNGGPGKVVHPLDYRVNKLDCIMLQDRKLKRKRKIEMR